MEIEKSKKEKGIKIEEFFRKQEEKKIKQEEELKSWNKQLDNFKLLTKEMLSTIESVIIAFPIRLLETEFSFQISGEGFSSLVENHTQVDWVLLRDDDKYKENHTKYLNFDYTKTFAKYNTIWLMIELAETTIEMTSLMKERLLEGKKNIRVNDVYETILEVQTKLFTLQEAFFSSPSNLGSIQSWSYRSGNFYVERVREMKQGIEKISEIKNFTYNYILNEAKKTTNGNQIVSNAVANAYLFQCLEWELVLQIWLFIKQVESWKEGEERDLLNKREVRDLLNILQGRQPEHDDGVFVVYDPILKQSIEMTIPILIDHLAIINNDFNHGLTERMRTIVKRISNIPPLSDDGNTMDNLNLNRRLSSLLKWSPISEWEEKWKVLVEKYRQKENSLKEELRILEQKIQVVKKD